MRRVISIAVLSLMLFVGVPSLPASPTFFIATSQTGNPSVKVWVNTDSAVYHCPGTRWYGATKQGTYMAQKEALDKGNRPAYGKYCQ